MFFLKECKQPCTSTHTYMLSLTHTHAHTHTRTHTHTHKCRSHWLFRISLPFLKKKWIRSRVSNGRLFFPFFSSSLSLVYRKLFGRPNLLSTFRISFVNLPYIFCQPSLYLLSTFRTPFRTVDQILRVKRAIVFLCRLNL